MQQLLFSKKDTPTGNRWTVSQLNKAAKDLLVNHFYHIKVEGEVSNLSLPASGHFYFSLKDAKAQIRCAMFVPAQRGLTFRPKNGQHLLLTAQVSLFETRGDYQLIVSKMQLAGQGDLQLAFAKLKDKLLQEGALAAETKRQIPAVPNTVALITSPTGAAVHDVLTVLQQRFPYAKVVVYPTSVQGSGAAAEIALAIATANTQAKAQVIILARGGGTLEDLQAFNEEVVARAILASKLPIISGIGHEVDFTIADFVADLRAATPSAAAASAVPHQNWWLNKFADLYQQLQSITARHIDYAQRSLAHTHQRLQLLHPSQQLQQQAQTLDRQSADLQRLIAGKISQYQARLAWQTELLQRHNITAICAAHKHNTQHLRQRLHTAIATKIAASRKSLQSANQTLNAISPLATLERGYAIVSTDTDNIVTSCQQVSPKDTIKTRLSDGVITSTVRRIEG